VTPPFPLTPCYAKNVRLQKKEMKLRALVVALCFILPGLSYLSADIYRWTDKQGTVHFGNSFPSDAQDVKVVSKEVSSDPAASAADAKSIESIIQENEADLQREREARKQAEERKKNAPPTRTEIIAREKERLEKKILELDEKPIEYYGGSPKIKASQIGYYQSRLQELMEDPDNYFRNPKPEPNFPTYDQGPSN
jgi:Domain of unknown function (DUF4124)